MRARSPVGGGAARSRRLSGERRSAAPGTEGRLPASDGGQITVLLLGYVVLVLAVVLVVTSASAVHLERKRLLALADGAAADAADAVDVTAYYRGPLPARGVPLTSASVRADVRAYLATSDVAGLSDVVVAAGTGTPDGVTAQVVLTARADPPLVHLVSGAFGQGVPLRATSRARVALDGVDVPVP